MTASEASPEVLGPHALSVASTASARFEQPPVSSIAVVVPTCRRPEMLRRCLDALMAQTLASDRFQIIVVDDDTGGSAKTTVDLFNHNRTLGPSVVYLQSPGQGPAAARNKGWMSARAAVIAFTDDDCVPVPEWLEAGLDVLSAGYSCVSGSISVPVPICATDYEANVGNLSNSAFVTANCFYRREALLMLGGFDERFRMAWREDTDLHYRLIEAGYLAGFAPSAMVFHPVRPAPWGVSLAQQQKSVFNALLYKKHPLLYRRRIQAAPPWNYYTLVGAAIFGLAALTASLSVRRRRVEYRIAAVGAIVLWAFRTWRFCSSRLRNTSHSPGHIGEMVVTSICIPFLAVFWRLRGAIRFRVLFL